MISSKIIKTEYIKRETIKGNDGIEYCYAIDTPIKNVIPVDVLDKIRAEIEQTTSRYCLSKECFTIGQIEWSDKLIKESEVLEIIDKYRNEVSE